MYFVKTPDLVQKAYKKYTWRIRGCEDEVFLTFDDGPHPKSTPLILQILREYNAKASFFCLGAQIEKHPDLYDAILDDGHIVGNHGYQHISGWSCEDDAYFENVYKGKLFCASNLYRPPFGRIKPKQAEHLSQDNQIVMWDVMSGDFDLSKTSVECFENVKSKAKNGSIIVLHDNSKALSKIPVLLPMLLDYFAETALICSAIPSYKGF